MFDSSGYTSTKPDVRASAPVVHWSAALALLPGRSGYRAAFLFSARPQAHARKTA